MKEAVRDTMRKALSKTDNLIARAAKERKLVVAGAGDTELREALQLEGAIAAPVVSGDRLLGVLLAGWQYRAPEDVALLGARVERVAKCLGDSISQPKIG